MLNRPSLARRAAVSVVVALAAVKLGAETPPDAAPDFPPPRSDAYRPLGPELFPLYQHYERTADATEVRNVMYLFRSTEGRDGSWSRLLAPLYFRGHVASPREDLFFLFPLFFFHKDSEEEVYNYAIPFFYDYRTPSTLFQLLFPFWCHTEADEVSRHHVLFPLFRHSTDESDPSQPVTSSRLGLWKVLELWESRSDPGVTDYRGLNFFNWKDETAGGLALYHYSWAREGEGYSGHTHLFPVYWHSDRVESSERWLFPLYGYHQSPGETDFFFVPLLSRVGGSEGGGTRLDFLFPLFHFAETPKSLWVFSFPLFGYSYDESTSSWNVLTWLYRTTFFNKTGKRTHSVLFPFSSFDVEPDGSQGSRWVFPYIETFNEKRLWRFVVPLYYEYQVLAGGNTDWFFQLGFPLYWAWGYPDDYFAMGFPLYWASRDGQRGWQTFIPFYVDSYSASSRGVHVIPFVSYRSFPSRKQLYVLGPLYIHEQFYDLEKHEAGTGNHLLWPFFGVESRDDGHLYRMLPFFWTSREGDTSDLLVTPFYYQSTGPRGTHRYLMPFYGKYESKRIEREFYAAGTYINTRERSESGQLVRSRGDVLWSLASFESEETTDASHQHVLPLGIWRTHTPVEDCTVSFPFYYGHRIQEGAETHYLNLVLGNLFFSKSVEAPVSATPVSAAPVAAAALPAKEVTRETVWTDRGFLWPLSRWYEEKGGARGTWVMPFYFDVQDPLSRSIAFFPFYYGQNEETPYQLNYFRYFFLADKEDWRGGYRRTFGQVLFDWKVDENIQSHRLRILYPIIEHSEGRDGYSFQFTPFFHLSKKEGTSNNYLFPIFWEGGTERKTASGETTFSSRHFFLFPLYGFSSKGSRVDHYAVFPFVHFQTSDEAFDFEMWPSFFYRDEPSLLAVRLWPLHADESRVTAGEFWVSRYLFLSKRFARSDSSEYRFDPFLFRTSNGPDSFGIGGLFELFAYDREGQSSSFRMIPLVFGYGEGEKAALGVIPFHYHRNFGKQEIDYTTPWRFLFLTDHLKGGNGERHFGLLWKLFDYTDNPNRPEYHETGLLYGLFLSRRTETSRQIQIHPFYSYYRNEVEDETIHSYLFSIYSQQVTRGRVQHRLFYFISF